MKAVIGGKSKYGIAGCGAMGLPMARALLHEGFDVAGFDVRPVKEFGDFADRMIADASEFSSRCDVVVCVVRDERQILDLCFDQQALFAVADCPKTFVLSSTVSPHVVMRLRQQLPGDVVLLDAPMSGAPPAAISATLTFMVGGDKSDFEKHLPAFQAMGEKIHHLGELGSGMTAKVLNNFVAASTVVAVRNVLKQADVLGFDQKILLEVMAKSSGQTWFGSNFDALDWSGEGHDPANTIGILEKDVRAFVDALPEGPEPLHEAVIDALRSLPKLEK